MPASLAPDDVIDAILDDRPVDAAYAHVVDLARLVRDLGEGPAPRPSAELATVLDGEGPPTLALDGVKRLLPRAKRIGLGTALVAASVIGAGAAGVLPAAASDTVRGAIEALSPVDFAPRAEERPAPTTTTPPRPPSTTTSGAADGEVGPGPGKGAGKGAGPQRPPDPGAPGDEHRPDRSAAETGPPGRTGETGHARADRTPGKDRADSPSATAPGQVDEDDG
jgi:hypothetical protein